MGPEVVLAAITLGATGVAALWKIANGLGKFEARTTVILDGMLKMLDDHEMRLREVERRPDEHYS